MAAVGEWFRAYGVARITVSSLEMAAYFADAGWDDITVAIPVNVREMETINALAQRVKLGLLVEHPATAVACDGWQGVDELRPGNFVFFDLMQAQIGVCTSAEIAVAVACPILATYPERGQVVVQGGAVHLGKEPLVEESGRVVYGYLSAVPFGAALPTAALTGLSQEHGTLTVTDPALWPQLRVGEMAFIVPVHSCLTADLYDNYVGLDGQRYGRMARQGS